MADGRPFNPNAMTAAMLHVPLGSRVEVQWLAKPSHKITVTMTDRGPYVGGRIIDLTSSAFRALTGSTALGVVQVKVSVP